MSTLTVVGVHPSSSAIPAETLRLSVRFAEPVARRVLDGLVLRYDDGSVAQDPFLGQELWSDDLRVLTLLFEPGRVKSSLISHRVLGPPLRAGGHVSFELDGVSLHRWEVQPGGLPTPDPGRWQLRLPEAGTAAPLQVNFDSPIDAMGEGFLAVRGSDGQVLMGQRKLGPGEMVWCFTPIEPWQPGVHMLLVHPNLENCCGDSVGEAFEHPEGEGLGATRRVTERAFTLT